MYKQAKELFLKAFDIHIRLLKLCHVKHAATEELYTFAFDLMHDIGEKYESVDRPIMKDDDDELMISDLYEAMEAMKDALNVEIKKEKDEGVKNLLLAKLDGIQPMCAKTESLLNDK